MYKMACGSNHWGHQTISPPPFETPSLYTTGRQVLKPVFKRRSRAFGRVSPASAHTAPLRPRLGSRAGSHSAHPQPRVLPVRCHHRSALPSLANRFSQWIHLACTAAPSSCEKWPLAHAPAIGSGRSLAPSFAAAAAPGSGPSRGARKRWFTWQGFACPVAAAH